MVKVTSNGHRRELLTWEELDAATRETFDYVGDGDQWEPRFFRYNGSWYDVNDAQTINVAPTFHPFGVNVAADSPLASWQGIVSESVWSGTVFRFLSGDDEGFVVAGSYYNGGE